MTTDPKMETLTIGLRTETRPPNVRAATKHWKAVIARGGMEHGIHVPNNPKSRDAIETAAALEALASFGIVTLKARTDWGAHYVPVANTEVSNAGPLAHKPKERSTGVAL